jgi:hypothetical protein
LAQEVPDAKVLEAASHWFGKQQGDWPMARFQVDAAIRILEGLRLRMPRGTVVAAGTGSGKTLAFYLPTLTWLAVQRQVTPLMNDVQVLALYPRNELLKDQLAEVYSQARKFDDYLGMNGARRITLGVFFGETPSNLKMALKTWRSGNGGVICPFLRCPECGSDLILRSDDVEAGLERLMCSKCTQCIKSDEIRLTRDSLENNPPDILFTSVEMLNQRLSDSKFRHLFGLGPKAKGVPPLVLLDEVHVYSGTYGAQVAYLLRRWSALTGRRSSFVGLSATISEGRAFFASLTGMNEGAVEEISPQPEDLMSEGAEYLVALRGDPVSQKALLSTSIQSLMLMSRVLDPKDKVAVRPFSGWRAFAFTDQMDATNRLFHDLRDAEGFDRNGLPNRIRHPEGGLAFLREPMGSRRRYEAGQDWRGPVKIGHTLTTRHRVERTTAYDKGVANDSEIIVATAALEVGYDDPDVGVVLQHKAPRDMAQFLQRKGRAGRTRHMRPWTIMVLSDYGRDRMAYQSYDLYFDPRLPARELPLGNRYVRRMQATYALIDYLGVLMERGEPEGSVWRDLQGGPTFEGMKAWQPDVQKEIQNLATNSSFPMDAPAGRSLFGRIRALTPQIGGKTSWEGVNWAKQRIRRTYLVRLLNNILSDPSATSDMARHLGTALGLPEADIRPLLWEHPRPVLLEVIPTAFRRLITNWRAKKLAGADLMAGHPLPDFVPGTLFSDLSLPEMRIVLPPLLARGNHTSDRYLPVEQGLSELAPGKVSRRFDDPLWLGVDGAGLEQLLQVESDSVELNADVSQWYELVPQADLLSMEAGELIRRNGFRPVAARLQPAPSGRGGGPAVSDTSNARLEWRSQLFSRNQALVLASPRGRVGIAELVSEIHAHTHAGHNPATIRRYAVASSVDLRVRVGREQVDKRVIWNFTSEGVPCGIGYELEADALVLILNLPENPEAYIDWSEDGRGRAARTARYGWEARHGESLAKVVPNPFQRVWLAQVFQTAATALAIKGGKPLADATRDLGSGRNSELFTEVLQTIFQMPVGNGEDEAGSENPDRLRSTLTELWCLPEVKAALADVAELLSAPIDSSWRSWLDLTLRQTLGAAILEAIQTVCPQVDPDQLAVDVDPGPQEGGHQNAARELWISEVHPGGNGLIEQVLEVVAQEPEFFFRQIEAALAPSELELIDRQLGQVVQWIGGGQCDQELADVVGAVRIAADSKAAEQSLSDLRRALIERGQVVFHGYVVTLSNRLLRSGTPAALDQLLSAVLERWRALENLYDLEIDARIICALFSEDTRLDSALAGENFDLPEGDRRSWRFNVLFGLLWAQGHALRSSALPLYCRYSTIPPLTERLLLSSWLTVEDPYITVEEGWAEILRDRLLKRGRARVGMAAGAFCPLQEVIREVIIRPCQSEYLNIYARLTGVYRRNGIVELEFRLPEGTQ